MKAAKYLMPVSFIIMLIIISSCHKVPYDGKKFSYMYKVNFEKDYSLFTGDSLFRHVIEYGLPVEKTLITYNFKYSFGFKTILDTSGRQIAEFCFDIPSNHLFLSGQCISDTSFFREGVTYHYDSCADSSSVIYIGSKVLYAQCPYFCYQGTWFIATPNLWYSFTKGSGNDSTSYTLNFEFDASYFNTINNRMDTVHFREGRIYVSKRYEDYANRYRNEIDYKLQISDRFIK